MALEGSLRQQQPDQALASIACTQHAQRAAFFGTKALQMCVNWE